MLTPRTGTNGTTSVLPCRGCAPWWRRMSMSSPARFTTRNAASATPSGGPMKVITVRFVSAPGATSSRRTPSTSSITAVTASMTPRSRPSLMFGTHSTSWFMVGTSVLRGGVAIVAASGVKISDEGDAQARARRNGPPPSGTDPTALRNLLEDE